MYFFPFREGTPYKLKINEITSKTLDHDIENGVLVERYRAERLQPQIDALEMKKSSLPSAGSATADFALAVSPKLPVLPPQ